MKHLLILTTVLAGITFFAPNAAEAGERCKTYTKPIRVDGRLEVGYGKACLRDGVWEIVKLSGHYKARDRIVDRIYDDLDDYRVVIVDRDYRYDYPKTYYTRHVSYSKPYKYRHAYKHAKHHYKKHHYKHCDD